MTENSDDMHSWQGHWLLLKCHLKNFVSTCSESKQETLKSSLLQFHLYCGWSSLDLWKLEQSPSKCCLCRCFILHKDQRTQRLSHFNQLQCVLQKEGLNGSWALVYDTLLGPWMDTASSARFPGHMLSTAMAQLQSRAVGSSSPFQKFLQSSDGSG